MSESRNGWESRGYEYTPTYSSESRESAESRVFLSYPSESRDIGESRESYSSFAKETSTCEQKTQSFSDDLGNLNYNNIEDIDKLIEKLEKNMPIAQSGSDRFNKAIEKRKKQISELKELSKAAKEKIKEDKMICQIEKENEEIDEAINGVKKMLKKQAPKPKKTSSYLGESRNSSESRW